MTESDSVLESSKDLSSNRNGPERKRKESKIGSDSVQGSSKDLSSNRNWSCFDHENLIAARSDREIMVSWGDDGAIKNELE